MKLLHSVLTVERRRIRVLRVLFGLSRGSIASRGCVGNKLSCLNWAMRIIEFKQLQGLRSESYSVANSPFQLGSLYWVRSIVFAHQLVRSDQLRRQLLGQFNQIPDHREVRQCQFVSFFRIELHFDHLVSAGLCWAERLEH